uniref:gap junction Cx32.7 protein-like n=1 Tax=Styela clava TaxID=7725 RepID=UPI001939B95E|nr:gap junction Cx32.7 protein-like [Styela clava]
MSWKYIDDLLLKFSKNSTVLGKFWVACVLLFRLIVITVFSESVWSDEQREFTCNTKQPGCENICFNKFTPISNSRLWGLQTLAISLPGALYFTYVVHAIAHEKTKLVKTTKKKKENGKDDVFDEEEFECMPKRKRSLRKLRDKVIPSELQERRPSQRIWRLYIIQIVFRMLLECTFVILQLNLYHYRWRVPEVFSCSEWPCPHTVDCFISRPQEKTVLLTYMYVTSALSLGISLLELWYIIWVCGWKTWESRYAITRTFPERERPYERERIPSFDGEIGSPRASTRRARATVSYL